MVLKLIFYFFFGILVGWSAVAAPAESRLSQSIRAELSRKLPNARIELMSGVRWTRGSADEAASATVLNLSPRGEAHVVADGAEGWVSYSAWVPAHVALRRIAPGERIMEEQFVSQQVNVASGNAFEYRGTILGGETPISGLETRQTVVEGQFLTSSAVQRVPDIRRGDSVRIQLISGGLIVSTTGMAEEPAYLNGRVRVMAQKTKREFVGQLVGNGLVEVKL